MYLKNISLSSRMSSYFCKRLAIKFYQKSFESKYNIILQFVNKSIFSSADITHLYKCLNLLSCSSVTCMLISSMFVQTSKCVRSSHDACNK